MNFHEVAHELSCITAGIRARMRRYRTDYGVLDYEALLGPLTIMNDRGYPVNWLVS